MLCQLGFLCVCFPRNPLSIALYARRTGSFIDLHDVPSVVDKRNLKENAQRAYDEEHEQLVGRIHAVQRRQEDLLVTIVKVTAGLDLGRSRLFYRF